jgi:hypothetical protein
MGSENFEVVLYHRAATVPGRSFHVTFDPGVSLPSSIVDNSTSNDHAQIAFLIHKNAGTRHLANQLRV